jgi:hypothetical protein
MTDEEKFRFDLQGFLLVEQVRSPAECASSRIWRTRPGPSSRKTA